MNRNKISNTQGLPQSVQHDGRESGVVAWRSPSNIAIIKYWGKHGEQLPANPSLSLTLTEAHTKTQIAFEPGSGKVEFYFDGKSNEEFASRVKDVISRWAVDNSCLLKLDLEIRSQNSFPHSAGIASSASAMSALALGILSVVYALAGKEEDKEFWTKASYNSRLGSGSACRSVGGPVMIWGEIDGLQGSSDLMAIEAPSVHMIFKSYRDTILLVDQNEKSVKSSVGHALMRDHPYAEMRFRRARKQLKNLLDAIKTGDVRLFGEIAEAEALDLHGMMMTSSPPYLLIKPNTISVINALHRFRAETGLPVFMTLDAGPNVHLLYPEEIERAVREWIDSDLKQFCFDGQMIHDQVGTGPARIQP